MFKKTNEIDEAHISIPVIYKKRIPTQLIAFN